jgi:hypothetical protein
MSDDASEAGSRSTPLRRRNSMKSLMTCLPALLAMLCWADHATPALTITGDMSVLTMAHEGSWGADTQVSLDEALQNAIARCKKMQGLKLGCGGQVISIQHGWLLGTRCGTRSILSSGATHADAEADADHREKNMRRDFVPGLPACRRVVSVDPNGNIIEPASMSFSAR